MKKLLVVLSVIIALIIVVAIIGWMLPMEHTATASRAFDAPAEAAWARIINVREYPLWRSYVRAIQLLSHEGKPLSWIETWDHGDPVTFHELEREEPSRFVAVIAGDGMPFGGSWTYEIEPSGSGCTVTITENGEIYDPFYRFFSRLFMDQAETMNAYLSHLEAVLAKDGGKDGEQ